MLEIRENFDIRQMTTFGLPAVCGRLALYDQPETDLRPLLHEGMLERFLCVGGGSNLLFVDGRYNGTALHSRDSRITRHPSADGRGELFFVPAAMVLDDLCKATAAAGYWGLENLSGIPGTVGGAAVQNAGAYGAEFGSRIAGVQYFDLRDAELHTLRPSECRFGYRTSAFKAEPLASAAIITGVIVRVSLPRFPQPNIGYAALAERFADREPLTLKPLEIRQAVLDIRAAKLPDPAVVGSAGSFFKNPVISAEQAEAWNAAHPELPLRGHRLEDGSLKVSAAWLVEQAGGKLLAVGGASVWPQQPLVIVNASGTATGADVVALEQLIIHAVREKFSITLTPEVIHIYE